LCVNAGSAPRGVGARVAVGVCGNPRSNPEKRCMSVRRKRAVENAQLPRHVIRSPAAVAACMQRPKVRARQKVRQARHVRRCVWGRLGVEVAGAVVVAEAR